jgi:glutamyl/glutaminyl-tRNA synthetase
MGYLKEAIINFIALLGWSPGDDREFFTLEELIQAFHIEGLNKSPAIFNMDKLTWFNSEYIRKMPFVDYLEMASPWFDKTLHSTDIDYEYLAKLMQGRTEVFNRIPEMIAFLKEMPEYDISLYNHKRMKSTPETALNALEFALPILEKISTWEEQAIHDNLIGSIKDAGLKNGLVLWPLRIALSGLESTPGGAVEIAYLLGKDESIRRVKNAIEKLKN